MKVERIIIHHEAGYNGFNGVNEYHRQKWNFKSTLGYYIGYQYYIAKDGTVTQGRADNEEGAHTKGLNTGSIGICLEGNFDYDKPSVQQMISLKNLITRKMNEYAIAPGNISGHRLWRKTSCPGLKLTNSEISTLFQPDLSYIALMILKIKQMIAELRLQLGSEERDNEERS